MQVQKLFEPKTDFAQKYYKLKRFDCKLKNLFFNVKVITEKYFAIISSFQSFSFLSILLYIFLYLHLFNSIQKSYSNQISLSLLRIRKLSITGVILDWIWQFSLIFLAFLGKNICRNVKERRNWIPSKL